MEAPGFIRIAERDGNIVRIEGYGPRGFIEVITEMTQEADRLILRSLHADGSGPQSLGIREIRAYARQFARQMGVSVITIHGGIRTSGARPGKRPRPITIRLEEPSDA